MDFRIKKVVKDKGLKMEELYKRIGMSRQDFSQQSKAGLRPKVIQKVADALGCSVFELIGEDENFTHLYNDKKEFYGIGKK